MSARAIKWSKRPFWKKVSHTDAIVDAEGKRIYRALRRIVNTRKRWCKAEQKFWKAVHSARKLVERLGK